MSYGAPMPEFWTDDLEQDRTSGLSSDQCVIKGEQFFVHGLIEIPVIDSDELFSWGVWVSLSQENYDRMAQLWEMPGRENEPPYFGWLSTQLPVYTPTTINLRTHVHTRPVGERPSIELEPTRPPARRRAAQGHHPGQSPPVRRHPPARPAQLSYSGEQSRSRNAV